MPNNDDWGGRRFGELSPAEKLAVGRKAFKQLQDEFEQHADEIAAALQFEPHYQIDEPVKRRNTKNQTGGYDSATLTTINASHTPAPNGVRLVYLPHIYAYTFDMPTDDGQWSVTDSRTSHGPYTRDRAVAKLRELLDAASTDRT